MKLNLKARLAAVVLIAAAGAAVTSCDMKDNETPSTFVESVKDMSGVWQLEQVVRNNVDISEAMDFGQFLLHLNADGTYILENPFPFPVQANGTWKLDDPQHPFAIVFTEEGTNDPLIVEVTFPITSEGRQIALNFSPGCASNKYKYQFKKVTVVNE